MRAATSAFAEFKIRAEGKAEADDRNQETRLLEAGDQLLASIRQLEEDGLLRPEHRVRAYTFVSYGPLFPAPTTALLNIAELIDDSVVSAVAFDARDNAIF